LSVTSLTPLAIEAGAGTVCETETDDRCNAVRPGLNSRKGLITHRVYA